MDKLDRATLEAAREARQPTQSKPEPSGEIDEIDGDIPPRFRDCSFESFDLSLNPKMADALEACKAAAFGGRGVFLYGPPGLGKTHLAAAAALLARHKCGRLVTFWSVPEFLSWLRQSFDDGARYGVDERLKTYSKANFLLVLDDLGAHRATEWAEEQLYRLLNARYENAAPTIATSNVPMEAIDPRIRSRFRSETVFCEGRDLR